MTLTIGRAGLAPALRDPSVWERTQTSLRLGGQTEGTFADAKTLRDQLLGQTGQVVPVTWTVDPTVDGFYRLDDAQIEAVPTRDIATFRWDASLTRVGNDAEVELESHLVGGDLDTTHDVIPKRFHTPPVGAYGYRVGGSLPFTVARAGVDGNLITYLNVGQVHPVWSIAPGGWYDGGCTVTVGGAMVAGREAPNSPASWQIDNTLVRVTPNGSGVDVASWGGAAWETKSWQLHVDAVQAGSWTALSVLHNSAERVTVRLSQAGMTWDLTLRRGSRFVTCVVKRDVSATIKIVRATAEAGTPLAGRVQASADDAAGNLYVVMSAKNFTADATNGGLSLAGTVFPFAVGSVVNGSAALNGDRAAELTGQYFGYLSETVRARPR